MDTKISLYKSLAALVAVTLLSVSCQKAEESGQEQVHLFSIPATFVDYSTKAMSFGGTESSPTVNVRFETSNDIYVYNETKNAILDGVLHPAEISADGESCRLTGLITGAVAQGDKLTLLYNMNIYTANDPDWCGFYYDGQDGTQEGIVDGGMATHLTAEDLGRSEMTTKETVEFVMQQSVFRLKLSDGENPITVKSLRIESEGFDIANFYWPFHEEAHFGPNEINVYPASPTPDFLYVSMCIDESEPPTSLTFTATDDQDNLYQGAMAAPAIGFKNEMFYFTPIAIPLTWKTKNVKPAITWTSVIEGQPTEPDRDNEYNVIGPVNGDDYDPSEITISGISAGYYFYMSYGATIHLNGLDATYDRDNSFIGSYRSVILAIEGANTITTKNEDCAVNIYNGTLKLSGSDTLTVTVKSPDQYGLYAELNYKSSDNSNANASALAAPGYTVTRSARTDNGDGSYTWTYTVAPDV